MNDPTIAVSELRYVSDETICGMAGGDVLSYESELPPGMFGSYSSKEVAWAIRRQTVAPRWRLYFLYHDDSIQAEIPQEDLILGGSFSENYQSGQRRSLSFTLFNESGLYTPGVNGIWMNARARLDMGITMPDGGVAWVRMGVYVLSSTDMQHSSDRDAVSVSMSDKWALFSGAAGTLQSTYEIPVNQEIGPIIEGILRSDTEAGVPLDSQPPRIHPSLYHKKTQSTISKDVGSTYADLLLELATQLSAEMFYDSTGRLVVAPLDEVSLDSGKASSWDFMENEGEFDSLNFSFSAQEIYNRVIVIGSTANGQYHRAEASNDDASSPTSVGRIGVRTAPIINDSNITTDYLAEERAQYELRKILLLRSSVSINVPMNPFVEVNGVVTLSSPKFGMGRERFVVQSRSFSLDYSGIMSVTASSVWNLPFLTRSDLGKAVADLAQSSGSSAIDALRVSERVQVSESTILNIPIAGGQTDG